MYVEIYNKPQKLKRDRDIRFAGLCFRNIGLNNELSTKH